MDTLKFTFFTKAAYKNVEIFRKNNSPTYPIAGLAGLW